MVDTPARAPAQDPVRHTVVPAAGAPMGAVVPAAGAPVAAIVLTGGRSRRMGFDKATILVEGAPLAARVAACVAGSVDGPVVEVGPGVAGCVHVTREEPAGDGPLAATLAGARFLASLGHQGPVVVMACDMPLVDPALVRLVAGHPGDGSVVPVVDGQPQPLCARWSPAALAAGRDALADGQRSMRPLLAYGDAVLLEEPSWRGIVAKDAFADVDTPAALADLGVKWLPAQ